MPGPAQRSSRACSISSGGVVRGPLAALQHQALHSNRRPCKTTFVGPQEVAFVAWHTLVYPL